MKTLTYIIITLAILAFGFEVYGERYTAIVDENDPSVQRLIHGEEQNATQDRKQSREEKKQRNPASEQEIQEMNDDDYRGNEYMERHARPPLYDRQYK
ncbi:hypothetical protein ABMA70_02605 [Halobacteriovorax sp. XZX-3]|uniref:hypothetical protein n=1 Tax=unclassified Halobacteriovorax TaxID=2639665 RepID=UPI000CD220E3|nr:hypothetical protein [Halobacteriovorax sp. DA5]POB14630.1 hypothetical protein C0Z22_05920 [Halobacteriovorax sp. DA5]